MNDLLTATVPCATIDRFQIGRKEFVDFPSVPDADERSETKVQKFLKFLETAEGITIISLLGCFILSLSFVLYLGLSLRDALAANQTMVNEKKRLLKDNKEMEMLIPENKKTTFFKFPTKMTTGSKVVSASPSGGVVTVKEIPQKPKRNESVHPPPKNETVSIPPKNDETNERGPI